MNEVMMLYGDMPPRILQSFIDKKVPVQMSYLSGHRWQVARGVIATLEHDSFGVRISPRKRTKPMGLEIYQSVGFSLKYGFGGGFDKFVFDTTVEDIRLEQNSDGDEIVLAMPEEIELIQRRSFVRVPAPKAQPIQVNLWSREGSFGDEQDSPLTRRDWRARLIDISAAGVQVAIDSAETWEFSSGQSVTVRFSPMPDEIPLVFSARIQSVLPTADDKSVCLGLQTIGLEASPEGRLVLQRLCNVVDQYHQIDQSQTEQTHQPTIS